MCDFNTKINTNIRDYVDKRFDIPDEIKRIVIDESISTYMRYAEHNPDEFAEKSLKEIVDEIKTEIENKHKDITKINFAPGTAGGSRRRRRRSTRTSKKGKKYSTTRRRK